MGDKQFHKTFWFYFGKRIWAVKIGSVLICVMRTEGKSAESTNADPS